MLQSSPSLPLLTEDPVMTPTSPNLSCLFYVLATNETEASIHPAVDVARCGVLLIRVIGITTLSACQAPLQQVQQLRVVLQSLQMPE